MFAVSPVELILLTVACLIIGTAIVVVTDVIAPLVGRWWDRDRRRTRHATGRR